MYAVIELGGRQWKVEPGTKFEVNRLAVEVGATHTVERVLVAHDGQTLQVGRPYLQGVAVVCEVLGHPKGVKTVSYHYRRRENWRKTVGHRQPLTRMVVKDVRFGDEAPAKPASKPAAKPAPKPAARRKPSPKE